jgi:holo-[acyl-carrier protein] synthase
MVPPYGGQRVTGDRTPGAGDETLTQQGISGLWEDDGMGIVGVGVDVVEVARLAAALERTPSLRDRLFTAVEQQVTRIESLAGRFAAKEAVAKVLGAPGLPWTEAEVVTEENGRPRLVVTGAVREAADALGISTWHLSLSHDGGIATAFVVAER